MQSELRQHWRLLLAASAGVVCSSIVLPYYTMGALLKPLTEAFGWSRADVQTALVFSTGPFLLAATFACSAKSWVCKMHSHNKLHV